MKFDALKHQGKVKDDLTMCPVGTKYNTDSAEHIARQEGTSRRQIYRYIHLTNLNKELLEYLDQGIISFNPAVELSYLKDDEQELLLDAIKDIKEGTIYPLLVRLEKKGIITSEMQPSPLGPSRKYYSITPDGVEYLNEFKTNWKQISQSVNQVFDTEV